MYGVSCSEASYEQFADFNSAWGRTWDIPIEKGPHEPSPKFLKWIGEYPERGAEIQFTLCAISDVFADTSTLEDKYGISLKKPSAVSFFVFSD